MPWRTWREETLVAEMKGINALNLEPALLKTRIGASPKSPVRKDFEQYLERRRLRLARVDEDKVVNAGVDTQEVQRVDEGRPKAGSPRSDLSGGASDTSSDIVAALYFLFPPESESVSDDESVASAATCRSPRVEIEAGCESVGSSSNASSAR